MRPAGRWLPDGEPAELTFDVVAEDLEAVRRACGAEQAVVLGHSILGALAIEYARRCPASVSHVVVGTPPSGDMARVSAAATAFFEEDATEERRRLLAENLAALPADASPGRAMLAQTPLRFFDPRFDAAPLFAEAEVRREFLRHLLGPLTAGREVASDPRPLRVPLLIAHGRYDYTVPSSLWQRAPPQLPTARVELFARSGHQPFFEEPERFVAVLTEWMAATGARG